MQQTILVVEDEKVQREVLSEKLRSEGFTVLTAEDGQQGLQMALSERPDIVILDNRMPSMSGFAMLKRLRETDAWGEKVPVIFFSNVEPVSKDERLDLEAISPTAYLIKGDTDLGEITRKIREVLGTA